MEVANNFFLTLHKKRAVISMTLMSLSVTSELPIGWIEFDAIILCEYLCIAKFSEFWYKLFQLFLEY